MAMVGKETINDIEIDEDQLNPDPANAMKPAEDENGQTTAPAGEEKPKSGTKPETANGEAAKETGEEDEPKSDTPKPPRTVGSIFSSNSTYL